MAGRLSNKTNPYMDAGRRAHTAKAEYFVSVVSREKSSLYKKKECELLEESDTPTGAFQISDNL